ncbi:MAG TPA: VC0807 family protein [Acidimicrobiales bacterium]|nr:VC0807 family protein [Acidimicrobiales bacterium]
MTDGEHTGGGCRRNGRRTTLHNRKRATWSGRGRRANSVDHHFEIPRLRDLARRAAPQVVEATLIPLVLFYGALAALGATGAICAALAWNYLALGRRVLMRERVPGLLVLSTVGLTARSLIALLSGQHSLFVYFLQPSLATALIGGAFLLSVPLGRPLAEKLAHDFVAFPAGFVKHPKVRRLFVRISLLWALVSLANAAGTILLLLNFPIATYLAAKTGLSAGLTGAGIVLSSWWFRRGLKRHNAVAAADAMSGA